MNYLKCIVISLTGDEEDIDMLAFAFLEEMTREDLLRLIQDMDEQELYTLMGLYLIESLKGQICERRLRSTTKSNP